MIPATSLLLKSTRSTYRSAHALAAGAGGAMRSSDATRASRIATRWSSGGTPAQRASPPDDAAAAAAKAATVARRAHGSAQRQACDHMG